MIELHVGTGVAEMKTNQSGIYMYGELKKKSGRKHAVKPILHEKKGILFNQMDTSL